MCKAAGGKWTCTPCSTLKRCIDNRPKQFNLGCADHCVRHHHWISFQGYSVKIQKDGRYDCRCLFDYCQLLSGVIEKYTPTSDGGSGEVDGMCVCGFCFAAFGVGLAFCLMTRGGRQLPGGIAPISVAVVSHRLQGTRIPRLSPPG